MGLTLSGGIHSGRRYVLHSEVIRHLCCPVCRRGLAQATADAPVRCPSGHSFDPARQGYVQLTAAPLTHPGDSAAMVAARATFLSAGHFATITTAVRDIAAAAWPGGLVADVGAGTGHHLAGVLDVLPAAYGLAVDSSKAAARRSANAHARADAIVADIWRPLADRRAADDGARPRVGGGLRLPAAPLTVTSRGRPLPSPPAHRGAVRATQPPIPAPTCAGRSRWSRSGRAAAARGAPHRDRPSPG